MAAIYTRPKLNDRYVTMNVCGTNIIGQPETGAFIGLNQEGEGLMQILESGADFSIEDLTDGQKMMMKALAESGFFANVPIPQTLHSAYLHVTSHCNLNCAGCYSYEEERNSKPNMNFDEVKQIIRKLASTGIRRLVITGGEPFMRDDIIDILKYAKEDLGIPELICYTNGFAEIDIYIKAGIYLDNLAFSLDAHDDKSATLRPNDIFNATLDKVHRLQEKEINVSIAFALHKQNLSAIKEVVIMVNATHIPCRFDVFTARPKHEDDVLPNFDISDYKLIGELVEKSATEQSIEGAVLGITITNGRNFKCRELWDGGRTSVSVSPNGDVYPHHMFSGNEEFLLGNILNL